MGAPPDPAGAHSWDCSPWGARPQGPAGQELGGLGLGGHWPRSVRRQLQWADSSIGDLSGSGVKPRSRLHRTDCSAPLLGFFPETQVWVSLL